MPAPEIAPVRRLYLPAGSDWYDMQTGDRQPGGRYVDQPVVLEHIPVFVRAGSIVPMGPVRVHAGDLPDAPLEIHVYRGRDAAFTLYEDEGDGYDYELGASTVTELRWDETAERLSIGERVGSYPGMPLEREIAVIVHDGGPISGWDSGKRLCYAGEPVVVDW